MLGQRFAARLAVACCMMLFVSAGAQAQFRFVAANGSDANPCSRTKPCRTLQAGINATPPGGEVQILNSGEYGAAVINKAVTISADGVAATILGAAGGSGISVTAAGPVVLRGLLVAGGGVSATGINIAGPAVVHIERCEIERFAQSGIALSGADTSLTVSNSVSRANGGDGLLASGAATTSITIESSRFENNGGDGLFVAGGQSTVTHSVTSGNEDFGIQQDGGRMNLTWTTSANNGASGVVLGGGAEMTLERVVIRGNAGAGLSVPPNSLARISNSVVTDNTAGILNNSGTVETRGNNTITDSVSGTLTAIPGT